MPKTSDSVDHKNSLTPTSVFSLIQQLNSAIHQSVQDTDALQRIANRLNGGVPEADLTEKEAVPTLIVDQLAEAVRRLENDNIRRHHNITCIVAGLVGTDKETSSPLHG